MTEDYVNAKVREALQATGNDKNDAQKLIITWAVRDQQLLIGLAKPHLKALAGARIDKYAKTSAGKGAQAQSKSTTGTKGEKRSHVSVAPPKSSSRQASVMHKIAAAFKKK